MKAIETRRLVLRAFTADDWADVHELAVDWKAAPGPDFDKWPTGENECKGFADFLSRKPDTYWAMSLREGGKVIGLLGLNGFHEEGQMDLGHVVLSTYQDNDVDREALSAMVEHLFQRDDISSIVTMNANHDKQLAPLKSLGFANQNPENKGELVLSRKDWSAADSR